MLQQNQIIQSEINTIIDAPTNQYPNRQFIIEGLLGQGKNSKVLLAKPVQWGLFQKRVVLKISSSKDEVNKQLYQKVIEYQNKFETQNNQNDNQSNFIRIYDQFDYSDQVVRVMEYGQNDLGTYLKNNQNILTFQQKQLICKQVKINMNYQILQSIIFLHSLNLIHRDISLDCYLMIGQSVKLINFGIAYNKANFKGLCEDRIINLHFEPPESQCCNQELTAATDIWSLACIFYLVMSGSSLFQGIMNYAEFRRLQKNQSYISEKIDDLQIPDEWKQTMKKMLHQQPNLRISPKEAMEQLSKKSSTLIIQKFQQPNFVAQQSQNQFRQFNSDFQQIQVQPSIYMQINSMISALDQPNTINQLLQQKEQSRKLLVSLKDKIQQLQNQLENNTTSLQPMVSFDTNLQDQQNQKKELPLAVQQSLDEIKKRFQEIEEKCISIQEEAVLNQNLQKINEELQILKNITQNVDNRQKEQQQIQQQVELLKERQKTIMKSKILEQELMQLQNENQKQPNALNLKKEIEISQQKIIKLEQDFYTIKYLQDQKLNQQQKIDNLTQLINSQATLENDVQIQRKELLDLKCQQRQQDFLKLEIQNNEKTIQQLQQQGQKLTDVQKCFEEQQKEIETLRSQLLELNNLGVEIKNNKDQISQMKQTIKNFPKLQKEAEKLNQEVMQLQKDIKESEDFEKKMANLNEQKQQLTEQKNQKIEDIKHQAIAMLEQQFNVELKQKR